MPMQMAALQHGLIHHLAVIFMEAYHLNTISCDNLFVEHEEYLYNTFTHMQLKRIIILSILTGFLFASCSNKNSNSEKSSVLLSSAGYRASCVYLTKDEKNNPLISWCETDDLSGQKYFFLSFFDTARQLFSTPVNIPIEPNTNIHEEGMPKVAMKGDGTIMAIYETSVPSKENECAGF